jgi:hypothetical protein
MLARGSKILSFSHLVVDPVDNICLAIFLIIQCGFLLYSSEPRFILRGYALSTSVRRIIRCMAK